MKNDPLPPGIQSLENQSTGLLPEQTVGLRLRVSIPLQTLEVRQSQGDLLEKHLISTAAKGVGEQRGSYQTPRGKHVIRARIGAQAPENAVFVGRRWTGEIWTPALAAAHPARDWILTRILWLSGRESGFNRLGQVDTMRRYVYIHGTPPTTVLGQPGSHGCVRMENQALMALFDRLDAGTPVNLADFSVSVGDWATLKDLALPLRLAVFVREQGVPESLELDADDPRSLHALARDGAGQVIGTARLLPDGHLGRFAVTKEWRHKGVGEALMDALLDQASAGQEWLDAGIQRLCLHAQTSVRGFYARFGFEPEGPVFEEAGLPHQKMGRPRPL